MITFIGTERGLEADVVPRAGFTLVTIAVSGLERRRIWRNIPAIVQISRGLGQAWLQVKRLRPGVVVGTGGYVSGPVCLAAALQGIPVIIHEQNAFPGLTNRWLARLARRVCLTFPEAAGHFPRRTRLETTGLPVRPEILAAGRQACRQQLELEADQLLVLIVGGSQGARSLNRAMLPLYSRLAGQRRVVFLHITGRRDYGGYLEQLQDLGIDLEECGNISIKPYAYDMEQLLAAADLVIGRAGASFLAEVLARGIPSILVPYPYAAANHQEHNARAVAAKGAAILVLDRELKGGRLTRVVQTLLDDTGQLQAMAAAASRLGRPEALGAIVKIVLEEGFSARSAPVIK
jgi:UDP-N-acetylglucosamine--N-acetylmuramyl-(pentapeptide) pyrophosphoryl-undecaprenol N-acetylglucosamine transferase